MRLRTLLGFASPVLVSAIALVAAAGCSGPDHDRDASLSELASHGKLSVDARKDEVTLSFGLDASLTHVSGADDHPCLHPSAQLVVRFHGRVVHGPAGDAWADGGAGNVSTSWDHHHHHHSSGSGSSSRHDSSKDYTCAPISLALTIDIAEVAAADEIVLEEQGTTVRVPIGRALAAAATTLARPGGLVAGADVPLTVGAEGDVVHGAVARFGDGAAASSVEASAPGGREVVVPVPATLPAGSTTLALEKIDIERTSTDCGVSQGCAVRAIVASREALPVVVARP